MLHIAFLRGINVGGNTLIKMRGLAQCFEALGFRKVKTVLASGNVLFEAERTASEVLAAQIEAALKEKYKSNIPVIVRTVDDLRQMEKMQPFKDIAVTPQTRLYVTFLSTKPESTEPRSSHPGFRILCISDKEIFSVLELSDGVKTPDLMKVLGKGFGSKITMRNWNTIQKILKAAQ